MISKYMNDKCDTMPNAQCPMPYNKDKNTHSNSIWLDMDIHIMKSLATFLKVFQPLDTFTFF